MQSIWQTRLNLLLKQRISKSGSFPRVAVLGVGNVLRSDDAAGMLVARALSQRGCAAGNDRLLICEAGHAPENKTAELRQFAPGLVLLIDAADMGQAPGSVAWIAEEDIDGMSASTHSLPLSMLAKFLTLDLKCEVSLLGIQPASNEVGETVSPQVLQAVQEVVNRLEEALRGRTLVAP